MRAPRGLTGGLIASAAILGVLFFSLPLTLSGSLRTRLAAALGQRFGGSVEIQALRVSVFPRLRIAGDGVVIRRGRSSRSAAAHQHSRLLRRSGTPRPARLQPADSRSQVVGPGGQRASRRRRHRTATRTTPRPRLVPIRLVPIRADGTAKANGAAKPAKSPIIVDHVLSEDAVLRILRGEPGKKPREFAISRLTMEDTGAETPWAFTASLTNPTPPGKIEAHGTFGPWSAGSPSQTPLAAEYTFSDADLGVFKGIAGILHSSGQVRRRARAHRGRRQGRRRRTSPSTAPITRCRSPRPSTPSSTARTATPGCGPSMARSAGPPCTPKAGWSSATARRGGRSPSTSRMDRARLEDVLFLAVKSDQPAMSGGLKLRASLRCRTGHVEALQKLILKGTFTIDDARFAGDGIQTQGQRDQPRRRRGRRSRPGQGGRSPTSTARFAMSGGVIRFSAINFSMPGAHVSLAGSYARPGRRWTSRARSASTRSSRR